MIIRPENPADSEAIDLVHVSAFGQDQEAVLVKKLRQADAARVSLVAAYGDEIAGHILFSPVSIAVNPLKHSTCGLAPLGVAPAFHGLGIGSNLVNAGLTACEKLGISAVVVLGDPGFYQRFGFLRADLLGLSCEYDTPPECFMVKQLIPGVLNTCSGLVRYHPVFNELGV